MRAHAARTAALYGGSTQPGSGTRPGSSGQSEEAGAGLAEEGQMGTGAALTRKRVVSRLEPGRGGAGWGVGGWDDRFLDAGLLDSDLLYTHLLSAVTRIIL